MVQNFLHRLSKKKNYPEKDVKLDYFRNREEKLTKYFTKIDDLMLVCCNHVQELMDELKPRVHKDKEWRPFIDPSKVSHKGVLLHNMNKFAPTPIDLSTVLKENHHNF